MHDSLRFSHGIITVPDFVDLSVVINVNEYGYLILLHDD